MDTTGYRDKVRTNPESTGNTQNFQSTTTGSYLVGFEHFARTLKPKFVLKVLSKYGLKSEHASGISRADRGRADAKQYYECERP